MSDLNKDPKKDYNGCGHKWEVVKSSPSDPNENWEWIKICVYCGVEFDEDVHEEL